MDDQRTEHGGDRPGDLEVWTQLCSIVDGGRLLLGRALQREAGLTLAENLVLCQIGMSPGSRLRMVSLAATLGISKSAVTKTVDRLEERGWVTRNRDPRDRRTVHATLTPAGAQEFARAQPVYRAAVGQFIGGPLSGEDLRQLRRLLATILAAHDAEAASEPA